jgi:hypothetical protein
MATVYRQFTLSAWEVGRLVRWGENYPDLNETEQELLDELRAAERLSPWS